MIIVLLKPLYGTRTALTYSLKDCVILRDQKVEVKGPVCEI